MVARSLSTILSMQAISTRQRQIGTTATNCKEESSPNDADDGLSLTYSSLTQVPLTFNTINIIDA